MHSYSVYTPRTGSGSTSAGTSTPPPSSSAPSSSTQRQAYLELSDLLSYEYRYSTSDRRGYPTSCEVIETRGLHKVKTTTRQMSYRLFSSTEAN